MGGGGEYEDLCSSVYANFYSTKIYMDTFLLCFYSYFNILTSHFYVAFNGIQEVHHGHRST